MKELFEKFKSFTKKHESKLQILCVILGTIYLLTYFVATIKMIGHQAHPHIFTTMDVVNYWITVIAVVVAKDVIVDFFKTRK